MRPDARALVCPGGGGHWVGQCCQDARMRCVLHPSARLLRAPTLWKAAVAAEGAWWCAGGHLATGNRNAHLAVCNAVAERRAALQQVVCPSRVPTVGPTVVRAADVMVGVMCRLTFHNGNLVAAECVTFLGTEPVTLTITLADKDVAITFWCTVEREGPIAVAPLPTVNAWLVHTSRALKTTWSTTAQCSPPAPASKVVVLGPATTHVLKDAGSGATANPGPGSAPTTPVCTGAAGSAHQGLPPQKATFVS